MASGATSSMTAEPLPSRSATQNPDLVALVWGGLWSVVEGARSVFIVARCLAGAGGLCFEFALEAAPDRVLLPAPDQVDERA